MSLDTEASSLGQQAAATPFFRSLRSYHSLQGHTVTLNLRLSLVSLGLEAVGAEDKPDGEAILYKKRSEGVSGGLSC